MDCPKCGAELEDSSVECSECGIIIKKFRAAQQNKTAQTKPSSWVPPPPPPTKKSPSRKNKNLRTCPDCGHEVSIRAKTCPNCGAVLPQQYGKGCLGCLGVIFLFFILITGYDKVLKFMDKTTEPTPAQKERDFQDKKRKQEEDYEKCKLDLQCWGEKHSTSAIIMAEQKIENQSAYQSEWTDGFLEPKLSRFRWLNKEKLTLTYIGDKIKFQNGFGAWKNMIYYCDYDPINKKVLDVKVREGRLQEIE